jgi:hypothetical protein
LKVSSAQNFSDAKLVRRESCRSFHFGCSPVGDPHFIQCHHALAVAGAEVEAEAVAGVGAAGEFAGGEELAIHMQTLAAGAHGGDDLVPVAIVEFCFGVERGVVFRGKTEEAFFEFDDVVAPAVVVAGVAGVRPPSRVRNKSAQTLKMLPWKRTHKRCNRHLKSFRWGSRISRMTTTQIQVPEDLFREVRPFVKSRLSGTRTILALRASGGSEFATAKVQDFERFGFARGWNPLSF